MPMACFGDRVENVRTLYMEIARASQRGRGAILEMSKEIVSNCNRFVPVGTGKAGIYTCLPCFKIS